MNEKEVLNTLLSAPQDSREFRQAAEAFETTPELQQELDRLAGGQQAWWQELQLLLRDSHSAHAGTQLHDSLASPEDPADLPLGWEQPGHPELLGRIGRYEIEQTIGSGGMGVVLRAYDTDLHRVVAIKTLSPHLAHSMTARQRFSREAQAAAAVVHPHVVQIYDVESGAKLPYLVMQYVSGESLQQRVERQGPLAVADALRITQQTSAALSAAHEQGLVHRDVKPGNILLEEQVDRALLGDFGLARAADDAALTRTGILAGTPDYMSPEQALGGPVDHRSDLFSLGSVLYFMLTGQPPFRADGAMAVLNRICHRHHRPLIEVDKRIPKEVSLFVDRLLEKDPAKRICHSGKAAEQARHLLQRLQADGIQLASHSQVEPGDSEAAPTSIGSNGPRRVAILCGAIACVAVLLSSLFTSVFSNAQLFRSQHQKAVGRLIESISISAQTPPIGTSVQVAGHTPPGHQPVDSSQIAAQIRFLEEQIIAFENTWNGPVFSEPLFTKEVLKIRADLESVAAGLSIPSIGENQ